MKNPLPLPKKTKNTRANIMMREVAHAHKRNPSSDLDKILQDGIYVDDLITKVNFGDDRLRILGQRESNFALSR